MKLLLEKIRKILRDRRARQMLTRIVSSLAAVVVFVTTYALVLPAITMESQAACGIPAHQHDDSCYEEVLVCGLPEGDGHTHTDACYTVVSELACGLQEHQHVDGCYDADGNLICGMSEHIHGESCYEETRTLTCGLEESKGHHHDASCYEKQLVCGMEAHTHSPECHRENSSAVTASTGSSSAGAGVVAVDPTGAVDSGSSTENGSDNSAASAATGVLPETTGTESLSDGLVPALESIDFDTVLSGETGFYYFHAEDGQEMPADSGEITDWKAVDRKTELASEDMLRAYIAYSIPAGSLNETNQIARYRLPANLHLTDDQILAINENVNGIASGLVDPSTGKAPDENDSEYQKYLGAEAVEGTRTPDQPLPEGEQEYISAVVKAENVYENTLDENSRYVDDDGNITDGPGDCIGQDLIFTFTPYTIEKNQTTYDQDGKPVTAGEKVTGWFVCDFSTDRIDWVENETDLDNSTVEKTAEILFVPENAEQKTKEISCALTLVEKKSENSEEKEKETGDDDAGEDSKTGRDQTTTAGEKEGEDTKSDLDAKKADEGANANLDGKEAAEEKTTKEKAAAYKASTLQSDGDGYQITLTYAADAQIPEGANLQVREILPDQAEYADYYRAAVEKACGETAPEPDGNVVTRALSGLKDLVAGDTDSEESIYNNFHYARFFDIEILDGEKKIEPAGQVFVNIKLQDAQEEETDLKVVHFGSAGPEVLETVDDAAAEAIKADISAESEADQNQSTETEAPADSAPAEEPVSEVARFTKRKAVNRTALGRKDAVEEDNTEIAVAEDNTETAAAEDNADISEAEDNTEIATKEDANLTDAAMNANAIDSAEATESQVADEAEFSGTELNFVANEFSVYAVVSSISNPGYNLDGQQFAIINTNVKEAVLGRALNNDALAASSITTKENNRTTYIIGDEVTLWTFISVGGNTYHIQAPDGRYMNLGNQTARLSWTPQNITVSSSNHNSNQLRLSNGSYGLDAWNRDVAQGFRAGTYNTDASSFILFGVNEIIQNQADKISLTDLINLHNGEEPVEDVVIYTRILNRERDGYDYYAIAADGTVQPVYDIGDTVGWTSSEASQNHLKWKLTVHSNGGEHNGYFDFQNMESGQYLIPTAEGGVKDDDPADQWDLGVNLQGWTDHTYGSAIERWDTDTREYVGYAYDAVNKKIVPTMDDTQKLEFFFAHAKEDTTPNKLHEVQTLDGSTKGIKISMYDFDGKNLQWNSPPRSKEMSQVIGTTEKSLKSSNKDGVGYANTGLMSQTLTNGYPTATITGRSLGDLFNDTHRVSRASNIFVKQVYDETGYFSYDSSKNYAYLDQANNKFILYRELAAPSVEQSTSQSGNKGNFFPFNSLQDLANRNYVFNDRVVQYDGDLQEMTPNNPQYGEKLYRIDPGTNKSSYFFGMTMEAGFYQGPGGKDEKGNDIIYEFNGDDDMWLYIDDRLVLDIGGCHGAVSGTINFSTGEVKIDRAFDFDTQRYYSIDTTLRQVFQNARKLPDGSNWTDEGAAKWFSGETFADYTKHSFKMFYMERGYYASNLKMNFNLLTIEPGSFVLEKKLPEDVQAAYGDQVFAYQIYTMQNGQPVLYMPPADQYVTYEKSGERVVPAGASESDGFKLNYEIDGHTYQNVYLLKPDEAIIIPTQNDEVQYFVREIGIDTDLYESVWANERELHITQEDNTNVAKISTEAVKTRGRVTYKNVPKEVHNLRLQKLIEGPILNPNDSFRFDVQLEDAKTGRLIPLNQGRYYIVKTVEGVDQYYKYENGGLVESDVPVAYKTGLNGSIDHIFPGYTILITGLLPGTDFKVTENTSEREYPEGYKYVKTEVENAGEPQIKDSAGTILKKTSGGASDQDQDALVKITNTSDIKKDITVEKKWDGTTEPGTSTMVLYRVIGQKSNEDIGKPESTIKVTIQADPAPVTTNGFITVHYTGTKKDGTPDSGDFRLSNTDGWSRPFEFERGGQYSFTYTPDGTRVLTAVPDKTGTFSESDTISLTTTAAKIQKHTYTFTIPTDKRPTKGSIAVTMNGAVKTANADNSWTVSFEAAEGTPVSYSAQPDGKFITGVTMNPETASLANVDVTVTMIPEVQDLQMVIPVSVDWSGSTTNLPQDTKVTFTFTGNGQAKTIELPKGNNWTGSVTLDRLDENGNLITYSVEKSVTTADTEKILSLENVPTSIADSGSVNAKGTARSKGVVRVSVQRGIYWSFLVFTGYTFQEELPVKEFEPGDTVIVNIQRKNHSNLTVSYRTSDGRSGTIPTTHPVTNNNYGMYAESFELTLPDYSTDFTIVVDDPWGDGAKLVSVEKKITYGVFSRSASAKALEKNAAKALQGTAVKAAPTHIASPEQTFFDAQADGSGDRPFKAIRFKDLPAGAEPVPVSEVSDAVVTLTGDDTYTWENLSSIDENGNPIYYYVVERDATAKADEMTVTYEYTYREDGTIEKVKIINTAEVTILPDTKDFSFTKKWIDVTGSAEMAWPSGTPIKVTIKQDENEYAKYTIHSTDLVEGRQITADGDTTGSKVKLVVTTSDTSGYVFTLTGLPYGDEEPGYTYYVSEDPVDGYLPPKYFGSDGDQVMGASRIGTGGTIRNDQIGYELPSTGGPGTTLIYLLGLLLTAIAGAGLMKRGGKNAA